MSFRPLIVRKSGRPAVGASRKACGTNERTLDAGCGLRRRATRGCAREHIAEVALDARSAAHRVRVRTVSETLGRRQRLADDRIPECLVDDFGVALLLRPERSQLLGQSAPKEPPN